MYAVSHCLRIQGSRILGIMALLYNVYTVREAVSADSIAITLSRTNEQYDLQIAFGVS